MKETTPTRSTLLLTGLALGTGMALLTALVTTIRQEIRHRGYPSWEECQCDFKVSKTIFQVWQSSNEQRGETIVSEEWGVYLVKPAQWLRRLMHYSAQVIATLNPRQRYLERVTLSPQEAYLLAAMLHANVSNEDLSDEYTSEPSYVIWRREVLHFPKHLFDSCIRRLYPVQISPERLHQAQGLPVLWDPQTSLPLATESNLLNAPLGTRIDCVGWSPAQITYCTARLNG
ncbi:hypothetical protein [Tengunoibacter tsumagoiensis]|uniref:Uncharacterized protein n=1 Tax=Tengunoibacter tsumagoiensis TaxID=2014871 RepID=A0A401ZXA6_9CHLR|nr:hypothetical protein [Tengunoibacter tsumagoiensis]GCE11488.1 hypothetical protein KTT_13470 [Tengunoibacter tsumagoiensis]